MNLFKKNRKQMLVGMPDKERMRYEIARNIYPIVIRQCDRDARTHNAYRELPETAAKKTISYAEALVEELAKQNA